MENVELSGNRPIIKTSSRWNPSSARQPKIDEAYVFYPTIEEFGMDNLLESALETSKSGDKAHWKLKDFKDPIGYIAKIRPQAETHGICKIVPPTSWVPPCPLKEKDLWENSKFPTQIQQISFLQNREHTSKKSRGWKRKRESPSKIDTYRKTGNSSSKANVGFKYEDEKFGFQTGLDFTLKEFQLHARFFKDRYFLLNHAHHEDGEGSSKNQQKRPEPSVEEIEGEYWRIIEEPTDAVEVYYGTDLDIGSLGSGFPKKSSSTKSDIDQYTMSGWNLNNLARFPGSALCFEGNDIPGVIVPWLYVGMCFSTSCWHVDDHHLYSLHYQHWGDPKVWYGVPGSHATALEETVRKQLPALFAEEPDLLNELVTQFTPSILTSEGLPVYRTVQCRGEFVLTFPRAYHGSFSCGFNCVESVNVAPFDWLVHGQDAAELYSLQCRKTSLSHDKLLFGSAEEAVLALAEKTLDGKESPRYLKWTSACGKDGVLTEAVRTRMMIERERLRFLPIHLTMLKMDNHIDLLEEIECISCFYDLHQSAIGCPCSPDRYSCLKHSNKLCKCEMDQKFILCRYTMSELAALVAALEGEKHSIEALAKRKRNTGVVSAEVVDEQHMERDMCKNKNEEKGKSSTILTGTSEKYNPNAVGSSYSHASSELDHPGSHHEQHMERDMCKNKNEEKGKSSTILAGTSEKYNPNAVGSSYSHASSELDHPGSHHEPLRTPNGVIIDCHKNNVKDKKLVMDNEIREVQKGSVDLNIDIPSDEPDSHHYKGLQRISNSRAYEMGPVGISKEISFDKYSRLIKFVCETVELVSLGSVMFGKLWSSKHAIYPKGFKSRSKFFSILDPANLCDYVSEVIDAGFLGPVFKVTMEEHPNETFTQASADKCWETVLEKLIREIKRRESLGEEALPPLELLQSINGHKMFGFLSPSIIQSIEALDPGHQCVEYWNHRGAISTSSGRSIDGSQCMVTHGSSNSTKLFGVTLINLEQDDMVKGSSHTFEDMKLSLQGLLKKASPDELSAMHQLFSSNAQLTQSRVEFLKLIEEIQKPCAKNKN